MGRGVASEAPGSAPKRLARRTYVVVLDLLRRHSVTLATASLLGIYTAKIWWHTGSMAKPGGMQTPFLAFIADDLLFWSVAIAAFLVLESYVRKRWIRLVTTGIAVLLTVPSLANVFWLRGTGSQLSLSVIEVGLSRTAEVLPIIEAGLGPTGIALLVGGVTVIVGLPYLFRAKWRKDGRDDEPRRANLAYPVLLALLGGIGLLEQRAADTPGWKLIAANVQVSIARQYLGRPELLPPPESIPDPSPPPTTPRAAERSPNILVVVLEATAYRATSLDPTGPQSTPTLKLLASEGIEATSMRAVVPHTTKSLTSFLCGAYPAMQQDILETAKGYQLRCLPAILADNGWATAFFQSADGRFEDRPRLVAKLGFDEFVAWQDIEPQPPPLSYLAADDMSLVEPVVAWARGQSKPFFATVLTSATHHAYELPAWLAEKTGVTGDAAQSRRYLALVHGQDVMLREILARLAANDQQRDTIVVVFGDHGEAFGEHVGRQHDNIFTDEGLHVPFVIHAPGRVPAAKIDRSRSLLDLTPTLLDLAGIPYDARLLDGRSLLHPSEDAPRYFACWYDNVCAGMVLGDKKLVTLPNIATWLLFDLTGDPGEWRPTVDPEQWSEQTERIADWYNRHRYSSAGLTWPEQVLFDGRWRCAANQGGCTHVR